MNRLFALLTALSLMAITLTPGHAFAYSAGDTCILTKIVELRIDPRSSGKKRYLKPGTEVVIIEKFRKRARVQVGDTLGTLGNRPISKACEWKTEAPPPEPEPEPEPEPTPEPPPAPPAPVPAPTPDAEEDSIELPPAPTDTPSDAAPIAAEASESSADDPRANPAPPLEWPLSAASKPPTPSPEPIKATDPAPLIEPATPTIVEPPAADEASHPWVDVILGSSTVVAGGALWLHSSGLEQTLNDDAVAYNADEQRERNTWYDINQRQSEIDHHRMIAMTSITLGLVLSAIGFYELLFDSPPSSTTASLSEQDESSTDYQILVNPQSVGLQIGF